MKSLLLTLALAMGCLLPATMMADNTKLEAEDANYSHCKLITDNKYSGRKALEITEENARISFSYQAAVKGKYTVYVGYDGLYGEKVANLSVNGGNGTFQIIGQAESAVGTYFMNQGSNSIVITPSWTWFRIDYIRIETSTSQLAFNIAPSPVDADATDRAREMYSFLYDNFGKKTISGIMTGDMSTANGDIRKHADVLAVYRASGRYPALVGFDFMNATGASESNSWMRDYTRASVNLAKDTYRRGGFPAFTWHWRDPSRSTDAFYTADCNMKITNAMNADGSWNTSSALYKYIIKDIDTVADFFLELQQAGMACIFRPLHESSGGWFWWGREGARPFKKLFQLVYEEMVHVKGVHNVIWVWNAGVNDADWNPGDDYYDIVSADIYNPDYDNSSSYVTFDALKALTGGRKMVALSENGPIPDIDKEFDEEAVWSWWMPWYQTWGGNFVNKTSNAEWKKCMTDDRVVTLEDRADGWGTSAVLFPTNTRGNSSADILFDLTGRPVSAQPSKGIYIRRGRLVIIP